MPRAAALLLFGASSAASAAQQLYTLSVLERSLTGRPLLEFNSSSWAQNTLNPSWLPLPGKDNEGGGLFFRVMAPFTGVPGDPFDAVGFVKAETPDGLRFPRVTEANILRDGPADHPIADAADPRAAFRAATGEYFVAYQLGTTAYPGRHTTLSRTKTPLVASSWKRAAAPMFAGVTSRDGVSPLLEAISLANCTDEQTNQKWRFGKPDVAGLIRQALPTGKCLSIQRSVEATGGGNVGAVPCAEATRWIYSSRTRQLMVENTTGGAHNGECLDVDHAVGPTVDLYTCHELGGRDILNQQWSVRGDTITSLSAPGRQCATLAVSTPQDCGTALWFADDSADGKTAGQKVYAVATFGELRGGNLSLVSSRDLVSWRDEGVLLTTRSGHWDNATLSTGPSPVRLSDGNWLLFYDIDNLWPVQDPAPIPSWGRCALGWAVLDQHNLTRVLARADEPLVHAQLPWERDGATAGVIYTEGVKPEGGDTFVLYAGGGDRVVEAFRVKVNVPRAQPRPVEVGH